MYYLELLISYNMQLPLNNHFKLSILSARIKSCREPRNQIKSNQIKLLINF